MKSMLSTVALFNKVKEFDLSRIGLSSQIRSIDGNYVVPFLGLRLHSYFQVIVRPSDNALVGHEALLRPTGADEEPIPPLAAFHLANYENKVVELDRICRTIHLVNYLNSEPSEDGLLFLNLNPTMVDHVVDHGKTFAKVLAHYEFPTTRIVIEIVEHEIKNDSTLEKAVENFRDGGYRIAMDDFGVRSSNFDRLWRLAPESVKLDGALFRTMGREPKARAILSKLVSIIHDLGAKVVMEGIETEEQIDDAREAQVDFVQGYLLGRPSPRLRGI